MFCPACGCNKLRKFENNRPVADLYCPECGEEFELKSQKRKFGRKVVDGAFSALTARLQADNNPNFAFLRYDSDRLAVSDLFIVPKHFFTQNIVEERKPLPPTAKRSGWIGCNILLQRIPRAGKIFIVQNSTPEKPEFVREQWKQTSFLQKQSIASRGWLLEVMNCVEALKRRNLRSKKSILTNSTWANYIQITTMFGRKLDSNYNDSETTGI